MESNGTERKLERTRIDTTKHGLVVTIRLRRYFRLLKRSKENWILVCLFVCRSVYFSRIIIVFTHPPFQFCSRFHFKHFCIPTKSFLPEIFSSMIPLSITNTIDYNTRLRTETTRNANENRSRFAIWWDREVERKNRVREHFCGSQIHKRSIPWVLAIFRICVRPFRCGRRKRTNQPSNKRCRICWMDNGKHARN